MIVEIKGGTAGVHHGGLMMMRRRGVVVRGRQMMMLMRSMLRLSARDEGARDVEWNACQSRRRPSQVLRMELVQQLLEGLFSCPTGRRHSVKIDRCLLDRA
jgi:hypothetical protein